MTPIVFVYRSKDGIKVVDSSEAYPFSKSPEYKHLATLDAVNWIQNAIEDHPELLHEIEK